MDNFSGNENFFLYALLMNVDTLMQVFVEKYRLTLSRGRICLKHLCSARYFTISKPLAAIGIYIRDEGSFILFIITDRHLLRCVMRAEQFVAVFLMLTFRF